MTVLSPAAAFKDEEQAILSCSHVFHADWCGTPHQGVSSNKMALITSDCGTMCSPNTNGPNHLGLCALQPSELGAVLKAAAGRSDLPGLPAGGLPEAVVLRSALDGPYSCSREYPQGLQL